MKGTLMNRLAIPALTIGLLFAGGCTRIASETYGKVVGPKGFSIDLRVVPASDEVLISNYGRFELGRFTDDTAGHAPATLFSSLPFEFDKVLTERRIPSTSGRALLIRGRVIYYESSDMASQIFGPLEEVIARVQFVDKASGRILGEALCVGRTTTTLSRGAEKKAEGLSRAIVGWLEAHNPALKNRPQD
jgi:hypothetical protein